MSDPKADLAEKEDVSVKRIAEISTKIREALRASLPTPLEQFLTVMVPGKVINTDDYIAGFGPDGRQESVILPYVTELNQARLCDDMATLSGIQLGPTGRSVARSYASTLTKLVPVGTTVGITTEEKSVADQLSRQQKAYTTSMEWLTSEDPAVDGKTRVDIYVEKQKAYTQAVEKKIAAFSKALKEATDDPNNKTRLQKRDAYDKWVNEHARTWRNYMQAAYMDWVVNGKKEEVEYHFAIVDVDSAMARVEASKETMRASTIMETDGAGEYYRVKLDPSNWAYLARVKADPGAKQAVRTAEWYSYEINRLQKLNTVLEAAKEAPMLFKGTIDAPDVDVPDPNKNNSEVTGKTTDYFKAKIAYQKIATDASVPKEEKDTALKALNDARDAMKKSLGKQDEADLDHVTAQSKQAQDANFVKMVQNADVQIKANEDLIKSYDEERQKLVGDRADDPQDALAKEVGVPPKKPDPAAQQTTGAGGPNADPNAANPNDFWTSISLNISSSTEATQSSESSSTSSSESTSTVRSGWWFWSRSRTETNKSSSAQSAADASAQMSSCEVKVSFECMRVDISRSWLRTELFYDSELTCAKGANISPGPINLVALIDPNNRSKGAPVYATSKDRENELQLYSQFPMFPTAFILASNVVLEITGATSAIQSHFRASSDSNSSNGYGYGPFWCGNSNYSNSSSRSSTNNDTKCETTASGCRISMKAPQIIGWVSQILPPMPRPSEDDEKEVTV